MEAGGRGEVAINEAVGVENNPQLCNEVGYVYDNAM